MYSLKHKPSGQPSFSYCFQSSVKFMTSGNHYLWRKYSFFGFKTTANRQCSFYSKLWDKWLLLHSPYSLKGYLARSVQSNPLFPIWPMFISMHSQLKTEVVNNNYALVRPPHMCWGTRGSGRPFHSHRNWPPGSCKFHHQTIYSLWYSCIRMPV